MEKERVDAVAGTILNQLGGTGKLYAMVGAFDFLKISSGVCFKFRGSKKYNFVEIDYDEGTDLYTVSFEKINYRAFDAEKREVERIGSVMAEELVSVFEYTTGLYLIL